MARSKKKTKLADLPAQSDRSTELDSATFLRAAQPVLKQLESDLTARAKASSMVTAALKARHASDQASKRTADTFSQWQQNFIDQVAAAWLLSCVFVRTLEDRRLLGHPRIAGPGASDSQKLFFQLAPSLTERDYLLTVFRELTHFEAARDLFDAKHNPVWLLAPSAEAAKALLALFRTPSSDTPAFRFGQPDTRFLGDLYQDLNERVRKRYALLQTPRFIESFILDRTLERAIERFGLDDTTVIDPTCGSGHFLLGSFDRLYQHRLLAEPGLDPRQAAHKALDAVFGADINPYAVGIARFRLTLSFLEKAGFKKLADAPQLPLHLVVADSLLHNPQLEQASFANVEGQSAKDWNGDEFALEDEQAARDVLHRRFAAVVGNPPYITVKDKVLARRYQTLYSTATGRYSLAAPFCQRFFQLGRERALVGMITANSFMKREFGKNLIQDYLPTVNLDTIVNTSGAYIPGHGTPTVLLFGTAEDPQGNEVLTVLAGRGEPSTPDDPERGHAWRSIADHWSEVGFENEYITVTRVERTALAQHPWSLNGGGAAELKELLESRSRQTLVSFVESAGFDTITRAGDLMEQTRGAFARNGVEASCLLPQPIGEGVRDWSCEASSFIPVPYDRNTWKLVSIEEWPGLRRFLWPHRTWLAGRWVSGGTRLSDVGLPYWAIPQLPADKHKSPLTIVYAFIATHNHFTLEGPGRVYNASVRLIKLPEEATEGDHLALLAYLNSSTACFWMKQVFFDKGGGGIGGGLASSEWEKFYEFDSTKLQQLPIPSGLIGSKVAIEYSQHLLSLARKGTELASRDRLTDARDLSSTWAEFRARLFEDTRARDQVLDELITMQEELDWWVYFQAGLLTDETLSGAAPETVAGTAAARFTRPALVAYNESDAPNREKQRYFGFTGTDAPEGGCVSPDTDLRTRWNARLKALGANKHLRYLERPEFKRTLRESWEAPSLEDRIARLVEDETEDAFRDVRIEARRRLVEYVRRQWQSVAEAEAAVGELCERALQEESIPFLRAYLNAPSGLVKHDAWEETWRLQRQEDAGEPIEKVPVPPKYIRKDFARPNYFRLRGKLDVPKERFISYPGCESDEDGEPLYGWAGWNHLERMQALAALYQERKKQGWRAHTGPDADGEQDDRLIPMLAGLLELLPWVKQWHNEPSDEFDGLRLGDYFERFVNGECRELGLTHDDLKDWRPSDKKSRRRKKRGS